MACCVECEAVRCVAAVLLVFLVVTVLAQGFEVVPVECDVRVAYVLRSEPYAMVDYLGGLAATLACVAVGAHYGGLRVLPLG